MTLLYPVRGLSQTTPEFRARLVEVASELTVDPTDLAAIMAFESGFSPRARNKLSNATGLIQWLPSTAATLYRLTVDQIAAMSAVEQLDLVKRYFAGVVGRGYDAHQLYMLVWNGSPAPRDKVLGVADAPGHQGAVYRQNSGLDQNKDGRITAEEASATVRWLAAAARKLPPMADPKAQASADSSQPSAPSYSLPASRCYCVRAGDTPWLLACRFASRGGKWRELYLTNPRHAVDVLQVGCQLILPEGWKNDAS